MSYFSESFWKRRQRTICKQFKCIGENWRVKGKINVPKEASLTVSLHSSFVFESCESPIVRKGKRSVFWIKMSKLMNAIFCSQTHIRPSLSHSHANKTVQKPCLIKFRLHSWSVLMPRSRTDGCSVTQPRHHWTGRELQHCLFAQPYFLSDELLTENFFSSDWIQRPLNTWNYLVIPELVPRSFIWITTFDKGLWCLHLVLISNNVILILLQCDQIHTDKADNGWW